MVVDVEREGCTAAAVVEPGTSVRHLALAHGYALATPMCAFVHASPPDVHHKHNSMSERELRKVN